MPSRRLFYSALIKEPVCPHVAFNPGEATNVTGDGVGGWIGGRAESCSFSRIMEKYMCRKHTLSTGLSLSVRLISRCSIVLSPCWSTVKIAHRGGCVYRPSVKGRVEAIVQIIQAKTKPNKIKPSTVEKNRLRSPDGTAQFSTLFKFVSSASVYLLDIDGPSVAEGFSSPNIISSTGSKYARALKYSSCPISI